MGFFVVFLVLVGKEGNDSRAFFGAFFVFFTVPVSWSPIRSFGIVEGIPFVVVVIYTAHHKINSFKYKSYKSSKQ